MFKKFFAKLASWNSNQERNWKTSKTNETMRENQIEALNAKEREERHKQNMHAEGIIPRIETDRPTETKERHDQAA